ncbi:MAG: hypothetical protein MZV70_75955 [Desulfobacterales bacterium]|nr:hypothetical protein [Desulfobacterales bacterium]
MRRAAGESPGAGAGRRFATAKTPILAEGGVINEGPVAGELGVAGVPERRREHHGRCARSP